MRYFFVNDDEENASKCEDCVLAPKLLSIGFDAFSWCEQLDNVNLWNTHAILSRAFHKVAYGMLLQGPKLDCSLLWVLKT